MKPSLIITEYELKDLLRTKKVLFSTILYIILFLIAIKIGKFVELISFFLPNIKSNLHYQLLVPYYFSIFIIPFISILALYDSISKEVENKSIKYLLYRISRKTIVLGKFLAPFFMLLLVNFLLFSISSFYLYFKINKVLFVEAYSLFFYVMIYSFYFLAFSILMSILFDNSSKAIRNSFVALIVLIATPLFVNNVVISYLFPMKFALSVPTIVTVGFSPSLTIGLIIFALIGIGYFVAANLIMKRKDVH